MPRKMKGNVPVRKVLIVDDEPDFVTLLAARLEANHYEVVTAQDGKEGLQKIRQERPDVVLLDIMLPKMDGLQVLRAIRRTSKRLPVFMITAFADPDRFSRAKRLEASGFLVKSEDMDQEIRNITASLHLASSYGRRPIER